MHFFSIAALAAVYMFAQELQLGMTCSSRDSPNPRALPREHSIYRNPNLERRSGDERKRPSSFLDPLVLPPPQKQARPPYSSSDETSVSKSSGSSGGSLTPYQQQAGQQPFLPPMAWDRIYQLSLQNISKLKKEVPQSKKDLKNARIKLSNMRPTLNQISPFISSYLTRHHRDAGRAALAKIDYELFLEQGKGVAENQHLYSKALAQKEKVGSLKAKYRELRRQKKRIPFNHALFEKAFVLSGAAPAPAAKHFDPFNLGIGRKEG